MIAYARFGVLLLCVIGLSLTVKAEDRLICCGGPEVFILSARHERPTVEDRVWRWQAKDSPEIPASMHGQFRTTDEYKPYGDKLLITSSAGGVALLHREDKKCLFLASARNAHSACLLPNDLVAVAASTGGDELQVFRLKDSGEKATPAARMELIGAHGAVWDAKRERVWALGTHELLVVKVSEQEGKITLAVDGRWKLPTPGGHDLSPARDSRYLFVSTNSAVYRFDTKEQSFAPFTPLADAHEVKSIDEHPTTGRIAYHQADLANKTWWSDTIRFLEPAQTTKLPDERLYKIRWDVEREMR
jgi:hypothetical protein